MAGEIVPATAGQPTEVLPPENSHTVFDITPEDGRSASQTIRRFLRSYGEKDAAQTDEEWLHVTMTAELPEKNPEEIAAICTGITTGIKNYHDNRTSLEEATLNGVAKEEWFRDKLRDGAATGSAMAFGQYLQGLDNAFTEANRTMLEAVVTKNGEISTNPQLHGFIFEAQSANSFNLDAALHGDMLTRARVRVPDGAAYGKNSVDIEVFNTFTGKVQQKIQAKAYADPERAVEAIQQYPNQRILVPADKVDAINNILADMGIKRRVSASIEYGEHSSQLITYDELKNIQSNVQAGKIPSEGWNSYNTGELALHVGKQAVTSAVVGAGLSAGVALMSELLFNDEVNADAVAEAAIVGGAETGANMAVSGALTACAERGILTILRGVPPVGIAVIACVAIDCGKIIYKLVKGDLTPKEALDALCRAIVVGQYTMAGSLIGAAIGGMLGAVIGCPVLGVAVGAAVVGMAGAAVGNAIYSAVKAVATFAWEVINEGVELVKEIRETVTEGIRDICSGISDIFEAIFDSRGIRDL